jgi:transcriptional regulator with XRE-family HTH domain
MDLKPHIAKKGLTQAEIARRMGWKQQMAYAVVNGLRKVPIKHLAAFEAATGISRRVFRPELYK